MSEAPQGAPLITCPGCKKEVWPVQELNEAGGITDKCPNVGCNTNLSHLITDAHREGHATTLPIRAEPTPPAPPLAAGDVAAQVVKALLEAGVLPKPAPVEAVPGSGAVRGPATDIAPHPGNVYPHPLPEGWKPGERVALEGVPPQPPRVTPLHILLLKMVDSRISAIDAERADLTRLRRDLEILT